jgi:hypothetical protein
MNPIAILISDESIVNLSKYRPKIAGYIKLFENNVEIGKYYAELYENFEYFQIVIWTINLLTLVFISIYRIQLKKRKTVLE